LFDIYQIASFGIII